MSRFVLILFLLALPAPGRAQTDWLQWGGPQRNFILQAKGLAEEWPDGGPRKLWSRALGEGYASVLVEGSTLYTMYRQVVIWQMGTVDHEVIVAMDAATGKTLWEHKYDAPLLSGMDMQFGLGPHSTPLLRGNRLFAVGVTGKFHALEKTTGKVLWSHDLHQEFGISPARGFAPSPIAYQQNVLLPVGGRGQGVVAFREQDGAIAWKNQDFELAPASPILINVDGQEQLVVFTTDSVCGVDPADGNLLWRHTHRTQFGLNISTPVWSEDNLLFLSSAYDGGSRLLHLSQRGGKTTVKEMWFTPRMRLHFGTAIRVGDLILGSSGDFGPSFLAAVDVKTGRVLWQDRSLARVQMVSTDGKLIMVDEDGNLALATASEQGLQVRSKVALLRENAWTPPTLSGSRLYVRDRKTLVALDLGQ